MQNLSSQDASEWKRKQMFANEEELLTVMRLAKLEFTRLQRYSAREIATIDLRFSLGIAAKRILNLVRDRKRIRARAARLPVVFFVTITVVDDDSLYNRGPQDQAKSSTESPERDFIRPNLDAEIRQLESDVQRIAKRIYSQRSANATSRLHNFSVLDSFDRALDVLQKDLWSTAAAPQSSFVVCDFQDCDQCAYREDQCVKEKAERKQRWRSQEP